jgi:hypothetical protein
MTTYNAKIYWDEGMYEYEKKPKGGKYNEKLVLCRCGKLNYEYEYCNCEEVKGIVFT